MTTMEEKAVHITRNEDEQTLYPLIVSVGLPVTSVADLHFWDKDTEPCLNMTEAAQAAARLRREHRLSSIVNHVEAVTE